MINLKLKLKMKSKSKTKTKTEGKSKKETYFCRTSQRGAKGFTIVDLRLTIFDFLNLKSTI